MSDKIIDFEEYKNNKNDDEDYCFCCPDCGGEEMIIFVDFAIFCANCDQHLLSGLDDGDM
jgi:hypothetical protein